MPLVVKAEVVDIRTDIPKAEDSFVVDTNVWCWITYSRATQVRNGPTPNQASFYPSFVAKAYANGSRLNRCGLSLAELAFIIEKAEREIYNQTHHPHIGKKEFRYSPVERNNVVGEIKAAWGQAKALASHVDAVIDESATDSALLRCATEPLDGYDLFLVGAALKSGITQIVSDDGDYAGVPGIQVFTANETVIAEATNQGMILVR